MNRSNIREVIYNKKKEGLQPLVNEVTRISREFLKGTPREKELMQQVRAIVKVIMADDNLKVAEARLSGMGRYTDEGADSGYEPDMIQLEHATKTGLLKPGSFLVDLGTGPGYVPQRWASSNPKNAAVGVDISASFAAANELVELGIIDGNFHELEKVIGEHRHKSRLVLSSLTLDRVGRPKQLLKNIIDLAGEKGGIAVASLFPLVPFDDEDVDPKYQITYTPERERIAHTGTETGDRDIVLEMLQDLSRRKMQTVNLPYRVKTHSGVQEYKNYHMITSAE